MTPAETKLWREVLRGNRLAGVKFLRQKPLDRYIVDFYCAELLLAVEVDGDSHAHQSAYDAGRDVALARHGIEVIRYTNSEVLQNLEGVYRDLTARVAARQANPPRPSLVREGEARTVPSCPPDKAGRGGSPPPARTQPNPPRPSLIREGEGDTAPSCSPDKGGRGGSPAKRTKSHGA